VRTGKLTADEIESIQAELQAAPGERSAILARHGLSELMWRIASPSS
jgi:hypothetical protein